MNEKLKNFAFHYYVPGEEKACALTISAFSKEDAITRVKAMSQAIYDGEIYATIPVIPTKSLIARLVERLLQK